MVLFLYNFRSLKSEYSNYLSIQEAINETNNDDDNGIYKNFILIIFNSESNK